jgi:hypothetical protein
MQALARLDGVGHARKGDISKTTRDFFDVVTRAAGATAPEISDPRRSSRSARCAMCAALRSTGRGPLPPPGAGVRWGGGGGGWVCSAQHTALALMAELTDGREGGYVISGGYRDAPFALLCTLTAAARDAQQHSSALAAAARQHETQQRSTQSLPLLTSPGAAQRSQRSRCSSAQQRTRQQRSAGRAAQSAHDLGAAPNAGARAGGASAAHNAQLNPLRARVALKLNRELALSCTLYTLFRSLSSTYQGLYSTQCSLTLYPYTLPPTPYDTAALY